MLAVTPTRARGWRAVCGALTQLPPLLAQRWACGAHMLVGGPESGPLPVPCTHPGRTVQRRLSYLYLLLC